MSDPAIEVFEAVDAARFREEIQPRNRPAVLRGLVRDWPAVRAGRTSPRAAADYLRRFDRGTPVDTNFGRPEIHGRFFYNERMDGLNFTRKQRSIGGSMERILAAAGRAEAQAIYIQSVPLDDHLPGFTAENAMPVAGSGAGARIWIGNRAVVQAHFDLKENIACVMAGRRRFTLFPPAQTPNLYPGPFELTLAGPPVSMVNFDAPDFERHPRFREALEHRVVAELEPGDGLYIPYFWWHHVEALDDFNVLVNYWWNEADPALGSPFDALLHGLLSLRDLPERQREAWRVLFDTYVFERHGDPLAHLPPETHGSLGRHDERRREEIRRILLGSLARQAGPKPPGR
jgi:hypothetical protein